MPPILWAILAHSIVHSVVDGKDVEFEHTDYFHPKLGRLTYRHGSLWPTISQSFIAARAMEQRHLFMQRSIGGKGNAPLLIRDPSRPFRIESMVYFWDRSFVPHLCFNASRIVPIIDAVNSSITHVLPILGEEIEVEDDDIVILILNNTADLSGEMDVSSVLPSSTPPSSRPIFVPIQPLSTSPSRRPSVPTTTQTSSTTRKHSTTTVPSTTTSISTSTSRPSLTSSSGISPAFSSNVDAISAFVDYLAERVASRSNGSDLERRKREVSPPPSEGEPCADKADPKYCVHSLDLRDPNDPFASMGFANGSRCPSSMVCCEWECCTEQKLFSGARHALPILAAIFFLIVACGCCFCCIQHMKSSSVEEARRREALEAASNGYALSAMATLPPVAVESSDLETDQVPLPPSSMHHVRARGGEGGDTFRKNSRVGIANPLHNF